MTDVQSLAKDLWQACDLATDHGCRPVFLAGVVEAVDDLIVHRDALARIIGRQSLRQETAGSDARGMEPQRSGSKKDCAGESRQTSRRRA